MAFLALKEYELLSEWISQSRIPAEDCHTFFEKSTTEVLFDVVQADQVKHELYRQAAPPVKRILFEIDEELIISTVKGLWQSWLTAGLATFYPFLAPVIKQPEQMRSALSTQAYQGLSLVLDGKHSLRDLAAKTKREPLQFAQALQPYIQAGWIDLVEIADQVAAAETPSAKQVNKCRQNPLIACIDDSLMICQSMEQVVKAAGYDFVPITDAARAINTLLMKRPDLIFLDLIMPNTNGYEICGQLRKVSLFKETPIIILSGNDGLVDQVRARLLGATDFLSKPVEPVVILSIIQKYLGQMAVV
ncbi:MAG TPA: response regulator [Leptolyngbyaceae cyanobacterium]